MLEIIEEEQQWATPRDAPERVADHQAARLEAIEGEADPARAHRLILRQRPKPFAGARHPGAAILVVGPHAPAMEQRAFDGVSVGALEVVVLRDGAEHAVEGAPDPAISCAKWDHRSLFLHDLAQPLADAALSDASRSDQDHQAVRLAVVFDHVVAHLSQGSTDVVAPDQRARANAEQPGRALGCSRPRFPSGPGEDQSCASSERADWRSCGGGRGTRSTLGSLSDGGRHARHAVRASAANSKRSQGRLASKRFTNVTAPSGASMARRSSGGFSKACRRRSSLGSPLKTLRPESSLYSMQPSAYRSVAPHTWCISCWICSGRHVARSSCAGVGRKLHGLGCRRVARRGDLGAARPGRNRGCGPWGARRGLLRPARSMA